MNFWWCKKVKSTFNYLMTKLTEAQLEVIGNAQLVGMVYPGIQTGPNVVMSRNSSYFTYATITSVYVYEQKTLNLINIITNGKDSIATISLATMFPQYIAISYWTKRVDIIDIIENQLVSQITMSDPVINFGWINNDNQIICFTKYFSHYFIYDVSSGKKVKTNYGNFDSIRTMAISGSEDPIYIGGNNVGTLTRIFDGKSKSIDFKGRGRVVSVQIDPNCKSQCLIVWNQSWGIFDIATDINLYHQVTDLSYSISSATWSTLIPGQFFTGDESTGNVRIWNASSISPLEVLNIYPSGITSLLDLKENRLLIGFSDGMIGVYDIENRKFIFQNISGHSNTIFTIQFHSINQDIFLTSGGEGAICTWNASTMKLIDRLPPFEVFGSMFSMDISPGGGMVSCGYSKGIISFFSLQTRAKLFHTQICESKIISLKFSTFEPELLIASSDGENCLIYNVTEKRTIWIADPEYHPSIGLFSIHNKNQIFVTSHDGFVYIYLSLKNTPDIKIEDPLQSDLYFISFSPIRKDIFITSDNSGYIKYWSFTERSVEVIGQHKGKSRPICFHPFMENLIASSGYDGVVMIHDLQDKQVISSFTAHTSNVYSISFSPTNPNLLITSASDSSIKFWSIDSIFMKTVLKNIMSQKLDWIRPLEGYAQLLKLIKRCTKAEDKMKFSQCDIPHINDVIRLTKKTVQRSISNSVHETRLIKRALKSKERLIQAAKLELFIGDVKHYCEMMFATGEFDLAVAAAPAVSVNFWIEMMKNRAKLFDDDNQIANYQLLIGDAYGAMDTLMKTNHSDKAFLVSAAQNTDSFKFITMSTPKGTFYPFRPYIDRHFDDPELFNEYRTASTRADHCLKEGKIYLAASSYLSVGDVVSAEFCLLKHGQTATAFLIDSITKLNNPKVREKFTMLCIQFGLKKEIFGHLTEEEKKKYVVALRFKTAEKKETFFRLIGLKKPAQYFGGETGTEKLSNLLLSGKQTKACEFVINAFKSKIRSDYSGVEDLIKLIELADLSLVDDKFYFPIVSISLYFAIYRAIWKGYQKIFNLLQAKFSCCVNKYEIKWLNNFVTETKNAVDMFKKSDDCSRIYYDGYEYLNPKPVGESYDDFTMYGKEYYLEDGVTTLSMEEALMWFDLTPFSPLTFRYRHYIV